ncbi:MAG: DNA-protecting protein DprA, partial [Caulobacteraceae bacterium]
MTSAPATGAISAAERRERLRLSRSENVGPVAYRELMRRYGTATRALEALPNLARRGGRTGPLHIVSASEAEQELERGARLGATLITRGEATFPTPLAALDPPPPLIWARGRIDLLVRPAVAV